MNTVAKSLWTLLPFAFFLLRPPWWGFNICTMNCICVCKKPLYSIYLYLQIDCTFIIKTASWSYLLQGCDGPPREAACHIWPVHKVSPHITLTTHHPLHVTLTSLPHHPHITTPFTCHPSSSSHATFYISWNGRQPVNQQHQHFMSYNTCIHAYMHTCTLLTISKIHPRELSAWGH